MLAGTAKVWEFTLGGQGGNAVWQLTCSDITIGEKKVVHCLTLLNFAIL